MKQENLIKNLVLASISAVIGFLIYQQNSTSTGLISTFMAAWILFQFRSLESSWGSLGNFGNPILFGINVAFATYIYTAWRQVPSNQAMYLSIGMFLIGGALSTLISKYWNMGP